MRALMKTSPPATAAMTAAVGVAELVLEVDAGDRAEPGDVRRDLGGVGAEPVLDVGRDVDGQMLEAADEVDRRVRGLGRAVGQPERGGDAEARRADGREAGRGEHRRGSVVPRVRQDERVARHVQVGEGGHQAVRERAGGLAAQRACRSRMPGEARDGPRPGRARAAPPAAHPPANEPGALARTGGCREDVSGRSSPPRTSAPSLAAGEQRE